MLSPRLVASELFGACLFGELYDLSPSSRVWSLACSRADLTTRESGGRAMIEDGVEQASASKLQPYSSVVVPAAARGRKTRMNTPTLCVYNQTRECFLGLRVRAADTSFARLKGLIGRFHLRSDEGIWVVPSSGVHTLGVLVRLDLVYLNDAQEVIEAIEHFPRFRIAPIRIRAASVLELPQHTIYSSQTQRGDRILICAPEEMEVRLQLMTNRYAAEDSAGTKSALRSG